MNCGDQYASRLCHTEYKDNSHCFVDDYKVSGIYELINEPQKAKKIMISLKKIKKWGVGHCNKYANKCRRPFVNNIKRVIEDFLSTKQWVVRKVWTYCYIAYDICVDNRYT